MNISIKPVTTDQDIEAVSALAKEIWQDYYTPIIGKDQVDYMLDKFQSAETIQKQIADGQGYYLAELEQSYVGYMSLVHDPVKQSIMISKIYTHGSSRGKGVGNSILQFIEKECADNNVSRLWLTVNKNNRDSIAWYKRRGFNVAKEAKVDIGNGFYMDDYIMEKLVD